MKVNIEREVDLNKLLINLKKSQCKNHGTTGYEVTVSKQLLRDAHDVIIQFMNKGEYTYMSDVINYTASEQEMPREPKFYHDDSKLPETNCNIPMPNVKPPTGNRDRICDTCIKADVCMYKGELAQAVNEIARILEHVNVFIDTDIRCKKWSGKVSNYRGLETK